MVKSIIHLKELFNLDRLGNIDFYVFSTIFLSSLFVKYKLPYNVPIYAFMCILLLIRICFLKELIDKLNPKILALVLLQLVFLTISSALSQNFLLAIKQTIKYVVFFIFGFYSYLVFTDVKNAVKFKKIFPVLMCIISGLGIIEYFFPDLSIFSFFRTDRSLLISPRIASIMQWPNQLGILLALALLFSDRTLFFHKLMTFLFTAIIVLTASRNGILALVLVVFYKTLKEKQVFTLFLVLFSFFMATPFKNTSILRTPPKTAPKLLNSPTTVAKKSVSAYSTILKGGGVEASTTLNLRLKLWQGGIKELLNKNLFFGIGPDNFRKVVTPKIFKFHAHRDLNAHNIIVNFLVEWGLLGLTCFFTLALYFFTASGSWDFKFVFTMFFAVQMFDCFNYDVFFMFSFIALMTCLFHSKPKFKDNIKWKFL